MRWCRHCASERCVLVQHQSVTFTASRLLEDGHWLYTSLEQWEDLPGRTGQTQPIEILDASGRVVSRGHAPVPPPETWVWEGRICEVWCEDVVGVMQYRVGGADAHG